MIGGRGNCSSLAGKLPARGRQAGHCGVAAQVTPAADADSWDTGELPRGPGWKLGVGALSGAAASKEWAERRMGGWEQGRKEGYKKKKTLELQSIKLLA